MTKFGTRTVLLMATPISPITNRSVDGAKGMGKELTRLPAATRSNTTKKQIGSLKKHSASGKSIEIERKMADVAADSIFVTDTVMEGTFRLSMDLQSTGTTSTGNEIFLSDEITVTELKQLELGWGGDGSFLEGASVVSSKMGNGRHEKIKFGQQVSLNGLAVSIQASPVVDGDVFGNLEYGDPDNEVTCAELEAESVGIRGLLKKQVDGVYVHKKAGMSDAAWVSLVDNSTTSTCA